MERQIIKFTMGRHESESQSVVDNSIFARVVINDVVRKTIISHPEISEETILSFIVDFMKTDKSSDFVIRDKINIYGLGPSPDIPIDPRFTGYNLVKVDPPGVREELINQSEERLRELVNSTVTTDQ